MRITRRQLKSLISEAMAAGGVPDVVGAVTGVPGGNIQNLVDEYKEWATEYMGTPSGANSASVLATFIVEKGLDQTELGDDIIKDMSIAMKFGSREVDREVDRARKEQQRMNEQEDSTIKYNADPALKGDQTKLPDDLQKGIIDKDEEEENLKETKITRSFLRRLIREELEGRGKGKGWGDQYGRCNTHNISPDEAAEAMAVLQEFGFEIGIPITVDSNNVAIDDALAAYPGEYTYEDFYCAVQVTKGRGA